MTYTLHLGDCLDVLKTLPDASVDAVVTDPPYELGFMGKKWDAAGIAYSVPLWTEALRVLKPGGHLLAFGGTRTYHRMAVAIEDAGFEVRDSLHWVYGSGFPKSLDVSKAIDKAAGAERKIVGRGKGVGAKDPTSFGNGHNPEYDITAPATDAAKEWSGWGTALKPAHEPVVVARKPLIGTVAANALAHGTGALNIDGCRVEYASASDMDRARVPQPSFNSPTGTVYGFKAGEGRNGDVFDPSKGRWPPNILLSHTPECGEACAEDCAVAEMDRQSGTHSPHHQRHANGGNGQTLGVMAGVTGQSYPDSGGASRFFPVFRYQAKASRSERERGLNEGQKASHPTVKPVELMRWLVRLVTPRGGVVLDPFTGSGTTGVAAMLEGFRFVGIEREPEYHAIATARINHATRQETQLGLTA